ncbi:MAG TPA: DUF3800 domain-containing protein [Candidatus Acidoferrum sp.]|nr:DUF3800 domain-containing protein [Candidatus Acidoferrum sp.]
MLVGHIDDSGSAKSRLLTLSCLVGHGGMWWFIEAAWLEILEKKNQELRAQGRRELSRYHASDCSNLRKEFKGWTQAEQIEFVDKFIRRVFRYPMVIVAYTLNLDDIAAEFPEARENCYPLAYIILLNYIVKYIAEKILGDERYLQDRIALIHDRGDYDAVLLEAFNRLRQDETLINRERFASIVPMGWEDCVPLQPADMIAYSNFRTIERRHDRRKDFGLILDLDSIGGRGAFLTRQAFRELREKLDGESEKILFKNARIRAPQEIGSKSREHSTQ